MEISIFLAKILGLYLLIMSVFMILKFPLLKSMVTDITKYPIIIVFSGFFTVLIGLLLIVGHNIWVPDWRLVITLFGWLIFLSGLVRIFFPEVQKKMAKWFIQHQDYIMGIAIFYLMIAFYLLYKGFL